MSAEEAKTDSDEEERKQLPRTPTHWVAQDHVVGVGDISHDAKRATGVRREFDEARQRDTHKASLTSLGEQRSNATSEEGAPS